MSEVEEINKLKDVGIMTRDTNVKKKTIDTLEFYGKPAIEAIAEIANMTLESEVKEYSLDAIKRIKEGKIKGER